MTADQARAMWQRAMTRHGESITLRRIVANASPIDVTVPARVSGYAPEELTAGRTQADRKILILAEDVEGSGFPLPLNKGSTDRVLVRGRLMTLTEIDDSTHRVGSTLVAYEIGLPVNAKGGCAVYEAASGNEAGS